MNLFLWNGQRAEYYRGGAEAFSPTPMLLALRHFPAGTQGQTYWYHLDGRGSVAGLTKHQGQSTHNYRYDAYGQVLPAQGNWTDPHNHYTFTGKEWDEHLGLYEFGVRLYDPWAGVWLTREPLPGDAWEPRTWHRYQYAYASPISYYDPYGAQTCGLNILTGERECFGERTGMGWTPTLAAPAVAVPSIPQASIPPYVPVPAGAFPPNCDPAAGLYAPLQPYIRTGASRWIDFLAQPWLHLIPRVQFYDRQLLRISQMLTDLEIEWGLREEAMTENPNPALVIEDAFRLHAPEGHWWVEAGPWRLAAGWRSGSMEAAHESIQVQTQVWGIAGVSAAERPGVLQAAMAVEVPVVASVEGVASVQQTPYLRVATNVYGDRALALVTEAGVVIAVLKLGPIVMPSAGIATELLTRPLR